MVVGIGQVGEVDQRTVGTSLGTKQINVPLEGGGSGLGIGQADDVAIDVASLCFARLVIAVGARVGSVGAFGGAGAVVGECHVELTVLGIDTAPFRPIHFGGPHHIGGKAGEHHNFSFRSELERGVVGQQRVGQRQLQPLASAILTKTRGVEFSLVQVLVAHRQAVDRMRVFGIPLGIRHKFVDVFVACVVAHVGHDRLTSHGFGKAHAFVGKAAQRRAFAHFKSRVVSVHFDHVAKGVHLVAVILCGTVGQRAVVPARVQVLRAGAFPAVAAGCARFAAIAVEGDHVFAVFATALIVLGIAEEVAVPVFFTGNQGTPRGFASATIVERATCHRSVGAELGHRQRATAQRAVQLDLGVDGDAPVKARILLVGPAALARPHFNHRQTVDSQFLVHLGGRTRQAGLATIGMNKKRGQFFIGGGLVVDGQ